MLKRIRKQLRDVCEQKHQCFADFQKIILRIASHYGALFPKLTQNINGSHYVYDFGVAEINPITVVKEHGKQEFVPPKFAKRVIQGIEDVLDYIEVNAPDDDKSLEEGSENDESIVAEEAARVLPKPKIPDGDCTG